MSSALLLTLRIVLAVCIPLALVLTNVRLLTTHTFLDIEYGMANFPPDPYGFTKAQRLFWAKRSWDYALRRPSAGEIREWRFADDAISAPDTQAPAESCAYYLPPRDCGYFYNDREIKHMVDVQILVGAVIWAWIITAALAALAAGALYYAGEKTALRASLLNGSGITIFILVAIVAYLLLSFNTFFTQFHQVFFEGDTWLFLWSDSLIRLFPVKFWQDAFIFVGGGAILEAALIAAWAWWGLK